MEFDYSKAFSRNIGWLTAAEQDRLKNSRIAIAGLGGVGGAHVLTLMRLGVGALTISDFDHFNVENFNRQAGATLATLDLPKIDCLARMARDINPDVALRCFDQGITDDNLDDFLDGADVYVDGIDFFALDIRRKIFAACDRKRIPALTAAPLGMGVALLYFKPGGMSLENYFRFDDHPRFEQLARFVAGLSPAMLHRNYLVVPSSVDFNNQRGPSTIMACDLCAGVVGTAVLKLLLGRGDLRPVPWGMQFDAYHHKVKHSWRPFGNANPLQQMLLMLIRRKLKEGIN